ncbi:MAG: DUF2318 domain-containing protein [Propionibacteriaceae bacterium]|jgi:uncharacterized membrane protein|nr:DUF2318 domain-containing protein [Propionibacteriaceae bacterium]
MSARVSALVLGVGLALARKLTNLNNEFLMLGLLGAGIALAIASLIRPGRLVSAVLAVAVTVSALPDVLLEALAIVPNNETLLSRVVLGNLGGYLGALALTALLCWAVRSLPTRWAVLCWTAAAAVTVTRILLGRRMIPSLPGLFNAVAFLTNTSFIWTWLALGSALVTMAAGVWRGRRPLPAANPALERKARAAAISRRRFLGVVAGGAALTMLSGTLAKQFAQAEPTLSEAEDWVDAGLDVAVALDAVSDGHLHRFAYAAQSCEVRFIVIAKNARAYGVGLDACNVCGPTGYYERDGQVICKLCDVAMNINTIGFKGGCNPIPIAYRIESGRLLIAKSALEESGKVFV